MAPQYVHLLPEQAPPIRSIRPFRAVIVSEENVSDAWRSRVAEWLVRSGCLYVVSWGTECSKWHDCVDWAILEEFNFGDIPDERFVMTTWHADEPLSEAFWFAENCAFHPDIELTETIILHISREARGEAMLRAYQESQIMADDA